MLRHLRCLLVWTATTCAALALAHALLPLLVTPTPTFEDRLVAACALALLACTAWAWLATTSVVLEGAAGAARGTRRLVPAAWRRVILLACGVTLAGAMTPAGATPSPVHVLPAGDRHADAVLAGLPFPSRPVDSRPVDSPMRIPHVPASSTVSPGDTLWGIAQQLLPAGVSDAEVAATVRLLHAVNRAVIGPDPDLIEPGQRLRLPQPGSG